MDDSTWISWAFRGTVAVIVMGMVGLVKRVFDHDLQISVLETRAEDRWEALTKTLEQIDKKLDRHDEKVQKLLNERR